MISLTSFRKLFVVAALVAAPAASFAGVFISVGIAPPPLPVYAQPVCPGEGYLWTPGYWAYGGGGYYWVPGVWVQPPSVGVLWTPPYWGFAGGAYGFHAGYWGPQVGFYGGVNYGFGYTGIGFAGGYWGGGHFLYNRSVTNVNVNIVHNTYVRNVTVVNNNYNRVSYNGGNGGVPMRATPQQQQYENQQHIPPTPQQQQHFQNAMSNRANFAQANGGHPQFAAQERVGTTAGAVPAVGARVNPNLQSNRSGFGNANQVNSRQGNQQSRVDNGVRSGQMTPGEANNVERRDNSIANQARTDRQNNGGALTGQERQHINQRQNNVSRSIYNDNHNANNDAAAAARNGRTAQGEQHQAQQIHNQDRPRGPEANHGGGGERDGGHPRR